MFHRKFQCGLCRLYHALRNCPRFRDMEPKVRRRCAVKLRYCTNCLSKTHRLWRCESKARCDLCGAAHHSMLHWLSKERTVSQSSHGRNQTSDAREKLVAKGRQRSERRSTSSSSKSTATSSSSTSSSTKSRHHRSKKYRRDTSSKPERSASAESANPRSLIKKAIETLALLENSLP